MVQNDTVTFSDADWATNQSDRKSVSGYAFFMFSGLVSWSSSKQKETALSSAEAEYMAITHVSKEALWIKLFCRSIGLTFPRPLMLLSDNQSAIDMTKSKTVSSHVKHIDIRYHFICDHVAEGTISVKWIPTDDMTADIFTKPLPLPLHLCHSSSLGLLELSSEPNTTTN